MAYFRFTDEVIEHNDITRYKFCPKESERYMPAIRKYLDLPKDWTATIRSEESS